MYGSLDISVGGMVAQRTRLNTIAANIANSNATRDADGNLSPFKRKIAVLMSGDPGARNGRARELGVHVKAIVEDQGKPRLRWAPNHPDAQPEGSPDAGYVRLPNIHGPTEQINAMEAQRAYEANLAVADAFKSMVSQALRLLG